MNNLFDVMVIGAGSAGRYGAKVAAREGASVALIEAGPFGGLCILKGCMPTKAYLRSSEIIGLLKKSAEVGIYPGRPPEIRFDQIKTRKDRLIAEMADDARLGVENVENITLLYGEARFISKNCLQVGKTENTCHKFLIATGSRVVIPPFPGIEEIGYFTSDDALEIEKLPTSMIVLGGGAEALEFGQFFNRMGVQTSLLQRSQQILSKEDTDIGITLAEILRKDGIDLKTGVQVRQIEQRGTLKHVSFERNGEKEALEAEAILLVTGRTGNIDRLHLEAAEVETDQLGVKVNDFLQTSNANIYAAGDVTGIHQVVNVATLQGKVAGTNLVNGPVKKADYRVIPSAVFTDPEFARVGLSEKEAHEEKINIRVGKFPFSDLGKAIVTDRMEGFIKIIAHAESGEILGVQILGAEASNLIHQATVAMHFRATLEEYAAVSHIHPTLGEIMLYLVEDMIDAV